MNRKTKSVDKKTKNFARRRRSYNDKGRIVLHQQRGKYYSQYLPLEVNMLKLQLKIISQFNSNKSLSIKNSHY